MTSLVTGIEPVGYGFCSSCASCNEDVRALWYADVPMRAIRKKRRGQLLGVLSSWILKIMSSIVPATAAGSEPVASCPPKAMSLTVRGTSMAALYEADQELVVSENAYRCMDPQRGDIVVVKRPGGAEQRLLKILVLLPGDRFSLRKNSSGGLNLYVNDAVMPLMTPSGATYTFNGSAATMMKMYEESMRGIVSAGSYFVLGTDPHGSLDSTRFGPVERQDLVGKVWR